MFGERAAVARTQAAVGQPCGEAPIRTHPVVVGHLDGRGLAGAGFGEVLYLINTSEQTETLQLPTLRGKGLQLHPVHLAAGAADRRVAEQSRWEPSSASVRVPARSVVVFVRL